VVLDIIMPAQDGIETLGTIKKQFPKVKLLMVSGGGKLNSAQYLTMALVLGADSVLAKPFKPEELPLELDKLPD
jgi:DNA-binding response OmpR family regulator